MVDNVMCTFYIFTVPHYDSRPPMKTSAFYGNNLWKRSSRSLQATPQLKVPETRASLHDCDVETVAYIATELTNVVYLIRLGYV